MIFKKYFPSARLSPYVQSYLEADGQMSAQGGKYTLFPNGFSGIFFNFGNKSSLIINHEYNTPDVSVFGQIDQCFTAAHLPGFYCIGVLVKPTVLAHLLRINMIELTNKTIDGSLIRKDLLDLHGQLEKMPNSRNKIELIENFLIRHINFTSCTIVTKALQLLQQSPMSIENLSQDLGISQRCLQIHFKNEVGLSPKTYSLIMRFKRMEHQLSKLNVVHWSELDFDAEYYDQNHFIKDFKRFTGQTPTAYMLKNFETAQSYLRA
ncbi:MAG: AraC family transcriptional regulator [Bacteroidetes bacterium]|nr:AraC family transcriptional regulator [Bacteroidota bacterium]